MSKKDRRRDVNKSDAKMEISGVVNDKDKCVRLGRFCLMSSTSSGVTEANDKVVNACNIAVTRNTFLKGHPQKSCKFLMSLTRTANTLVKFFFWRDLFSLYIFWILFFTFFFYETSLFYIKLTVK